MKLKSYLIDINYFCLILFAFTIPFAPSINSFILIFWSVSFIITIFFKNIKLVGSLPILFICYFFITLIGVIYSENINEAFKHVEVKASFLLLPFLLSNSPKIEIRKIIWFFTFGVLTISLICLIASFIKIFLHYHATREISASLLFHTELSSPFGLHHIYFSLYVTFCFFFILNEFIQRDISKNRKWQLGLLLFYFLIFNFLLSSRAGIISFFLIMVLLLLIFLFQTKKFIKGAFIFIALLGGLLIFYFNFPYAKNRITENLSLEMPPTLDSPHEEFNETTGRIGIWICALEVIASNPWFGVGTGDSSDELQKVYLEKGFSIGYVWRFNAHNEFLQTTIRNGILGFIVLFLIFLGYLISFVKFKSYYGLIFFILVFNFAMIESILGTHKGVIFLIFIGLIIYLGHKEFKEPSLVKTRED